MRFKYIFFALILAAVVMGCASPPTQEMENAREAVFKAENDPDAVIYGASSLARAREALRRMQEEADSKRYDAAKNYAAEAIAAAEKAISDGKAGASRADNESGSIIAGLRPEIEETSRNVNGARYRQLDLDFDALENGIRDAYSTTDQAEDDYAAGKFQEALDKARIVRANLADINRQITNAVPRSKS